MMSGLTDEVEKVGRHLEVLEYIDREHPIGIPTLARETGYARHKIRHSERILKKQGYIESTNRGAVPCSSTVDTEINGKIDAVIARLEEVEDELEATRPSSVH